MRKRIGFITIVSLFPYIFQGALCFGQGIEIESGASITISGAASIEIIDGSFINNGTYTKATEELSFSGSTAGTISGSSISDFYDLSNLNSGGITIESAARITVSNNFTNTELFSIDSDASGSGSLIVNGTSSGQIVFNRYIPTLNRWHLVSSPVPGQSIQSFLTANTNIPIKVNDPDPDEYGIMDHNDTDGGWNGYFTSGTSGTMTVGKGYCVRISSGTDLTFTGNVLTSTNSPAVTASSWNCLGNPFTSSLDITNATNGFIASNSTNLGGSTASIYVWNEDISDYSGATNLYDVINQSVGNNDYIQPGQAFLVYPTTGSSLSFTTTMRSHQNETFYKKSTSDNRYALISLFVSNETNSFSTAICFEEGASFGLDVGYDAVLYGANDKLSLYTHLIEDNGEDFMYQSLPISGFEDMEIPLGLDCSLPGLLTFSIEDTINLAGAGSGAILEDRELNIFTDLTKTSSYTFNVEAPLFGTGRFFLHPNKDQSASGIKGNVLNARIFTAQKNLYINGQIESSWTACIYDIMGRQVKSFQLEPGNSNVLNLGDFDDGIYIILISDGILNQTQKILLK